jgi:hypothetical protein
MCWDSFEVMSCRPWACQLLFLQEGGAPHFTLNFWKEALEASAADNRMPEYD